MLVWGCTRLGRLIPDLERLVRLWGVGWSPEQVSWLCLVQQLWWGADCYLLGTSDKCQDGGPTSSQKGWMLHGQATPADDDHHPLRSWAMLR